MRRRGWLAMFLRLIIGVMFAGAILIAFHLLMKPIDLVTVVIGLLVITPIFAFAMRSPLGFFGLRRTESDREPEDE